MPSRHLVRSLPFIALGLVLAASCGPATKGPEKAAKPAEHPAHEATPASTPAATGTPTQTQTATTEGSTPSAGPTPTPQEAAKSAPKPAPTPKPVPTPKATPTPKEAPTPKPTPSPTPTPPSTPVPANGGGVLTGKVTLVGAGGTPETSSSGVVVYLPGVHRRSGPHPSATMTSHNKTFEPHIIAVSVGDAVAFPNLDKIHHNVFSLSEANKFDLGLYKNGASRSQVFAKPCVCRVYCNIHAQMSGVVVVTDGDAYAVTSADGSYKIDGIPPGKHTVMVWHEKAGEAKDEVDIVAGKDVARDFKMDTTGFKESPHTNKYGKPYGKDDDARY